MSQRDRLMGRQLPTTVWKLMVDDDTAARAELDRAETALEIAQMGPQDDEAKAEVEKARARVDAARAAVEACYEPITIQAVEPTRFEELAKDHPKRKDTDEPWNMSALSRALFYEGVRSEMSREEWDHILDHQMTYAERDGIDGVLMAALYVNGRTPSEIVPKG
jgi:hypothetical protein